MEKNKTKVYVLSKLQFRDILTINSINESNVSEIKAAFISINDRSNSFWGKPFFDNKHDNLLTLVFDDVEQDGFDSPTNSNKNTKAFSKDDAKEVIKFLNNNKDKEVFFVHCAAGISRSGAIGQFIVDYLDGDKEFFKIKNSHISPNARVLRILHNLINGYDNEDDSR